jgi:glycosyltransferase involved in cell wall biosynthesis
MRILIATSSLPPASGIGNYVYNLAKWIGSSGHEVLVCRSFCSQKGNVESFPYKVIDISVPFRPEDEYKAIFQLYNLILEFSPEAIINNDNIYLSNLLPYLFPEVVRLSVVHGYRRKSISWDAHRMIFHGALLNHEHIDYIIAISTPMKEGIMKKYGCPADQVKLVFNGVWSDSELETQEHSINNKLVKIIFAGGKSRTKGADVMLSTARKMANTKVNGYQINWIGNLPVKGRYSKQRLETIPCVQAFGGLQHEQLQKILSPADILVMPSRAEGCPMLLLEAMSKGMLTVVSNCPSAMAEIVEAANCGFAVPVGSSKGLSWILLKLIKSNETRRFMSENAINFYKKNLTMDCCGKKIEELCKKPRPGRKKTKGEFPPLYFVPYHRRPYPTGSVLKPAAVIQRIRYIFGWLPKKMYISRGAVD